MASPEQKNSKDPYCLAKEIQTRTYTTSPEHSELSRTESVTFHRSPLYSLSNNRPGSPAVPQTHFVLPEHMTLGKSLNLGFILLNYKMGIIILA